MLVRRILATFTVAAVMLPSAVAFAQDHHDDHQDDHGGYTHHDDHSGYVRHDEWKKGYHMRDEDWRRGQQVDWRAHHLRQPPRGYEWREVDGNYVMAAVATGIIASTIIAAGH